MSVKAVCIATVLFCSLIGVSDEWHQSFVPGRSGNDVWDWTADTIGGLLAAMLGRRIK
jgi:VanZ family protein